MEESIFYELDDELDTVRGIVVSEEMLKTGRWGNPAKWVDKNTYKPIREAKQTILLEKDEPTKSKKVIDSEKFIEEQKAIRKNRIDGKL